MTASLLAVYSLPQIDSRFAFFTFTAAPIDDRKNRYSKENSSIIVGAIQWIHLDSRRAGEQLRTRQFWK